MSTTTAEKGTSVLSDLFDGQDLPLNLAADRAEYVSLMRRIGLVEGEAGTPVSAFNSSI
jgi:hypothetical protein